MRPCLSNDIEFLISIFVKNCWATLKYLSDFINNLTDINMFTSSIKHHLNGFFFTMKMVIGVLSANSLTNVYEFNIL